MHVIIKLLFVRIVWEIEVLNIQYSIWKTDKIFVAVSFLSNPLRSLRMRTVRRTTKVYACSSKTISRINVRLPIVSNLEMYESHRMCIPQTTDQEQHKLQKIKELTNILKVSFSRTDD